VQKKKVRKKIHPTQNFLMHFFRGQESDSEQKLVWSDQKGRRNAPFEEIL